MGAVRYSGGKVGNSPQVTDKATVTDTNDTQPEEQPVVKRSRVSPDLTIDDLSQFTPSSSQPQTRPHSQSSHRPQSFLDMIPISLTATYPPCYVTKRRAYAEAVKAREIAIVEAQEVKDDCGMMLKRSMFIELRLGTVYLSTRRLRLPNGSERGKRKKKSWQLRRRRWRRAVEEKKCEHTEMKDNNVVLMATSLLRQTLQIHQQFIQHYLRRDLLFLNHPNQKKILWITCHQSRNHRVRCVLLKYPIFQFHLLHRRLLKWNFIVMIIIWKSR